MYYIVSGTCFYEDADTKIQLKHNTIYLLPTSKVYSVTEDPNDKVNHYYIHFMFTAQVQEILAFNILESEISLDLFNLIKKCIVLKDKNYLVRLSEIFCGSWRGAVANTVYGLYFALLFQ